MTAVLFAVLALAIGSSSAMMQSGPVNTAIQTMAGPTMGGAGATTNTANVPSTMPNNNFGQTNQMPFNPYPSNTFPQQNFMGQHMGFPGNNFAMGGMPGMNGMNMPGMGMSGMGMQGQQQEQQQNSMNSLFPLIAMNGNDAVRNMAMMSAFSGNRGGNMLSALAFGGGMGDAMQQMALLSGLNRQGGMGAMGGLPMMALLGGGEMSNMLPFMIGMGQGGQSGQGQSGFGQSGQAGYGSAGQSFGQNSMGGFGGNPALFALLGGGF